jgi:hypothetical protein
MEIGRSVVTFDDSHGAAGAEQSVENHQGLNGSRQVLQHETDEDVIEGLRGERQSEDVRLLEHHIAESRRIGRLLGSRKRFRGNINRRESCIRASLS